MKAILRDKLYIPMADVTETALEFIEAKFRTVLYDEQACRQCSNKPDRPNNQCRACESFLGDYKFYAYTHNGKYVGIDVGRRDLVTSLFERLGDVEVSDRRPAPPMRNKGMKFNFDVAYDYQVPAIAAMVKYGRGVLESAPRTGKTAMAAAVSLELGLKTIIVAHQSDLLTQIYNTYMGIDTAVQFTNCGDFEDAVGFCKTLADFEKYDVCLSTYQTFLSKGGQRLLKQICGMFGTVIVDEVHRSGADRYGEIISRFNSKVRIGMTATYERKDRKHLIVNHVFGSVTHSTPAKSLKPVVSVIDTGVKCRKTYKIWQYAMKFLENSVPRNRCILKYIKHDVEAGRSILIPVTSHAYNSFLVAAINKVCGKQVAKGWHGKLKPADRVNILNEARSGELRVVVATRSMLTGVNVQRWDCLYEVMPINNPPNFRQEYRRICTPMEGKPKPVIRFFVDQWGLTQRCFIHCVKVFKEDEIPFTKAGAELIKETNKRLRVGSNDVHEYAPAPRKYEPRKTKPSVPDIGILRGSL